MSDGYSFTPNEVADDKSLNERFGDIHRRLIGVEQKALTINEAEANIVGTALKRIDAVLKPAFESIAERAHLGALLSATCEQEVAFPVNGQVSFLVVETDRLTFAPSPYLAFNSQGDPNVGMTGTLVSYVPATGLLIVDIDNSVGDGTHTHWNVGLSTPADLAHKDRTDNPHGVTAAQVGAPTIAEMQQEIANFVGGAPEALDAMNEFADAINNDENYAASVAAQFTALGALANLDKVGPSELSSDLMPILQIKTMVDETDYTRTGPTLANMGNAFSITPKSTTSTSTLIMLWVADLHVTENTTGDDLGFYVYPQYYRSSDTTYYSAGQIMRQLVNNLDGSTSHASANGNSSLCFLSNADNYQNNGDWYVRLRGKENYSGTGTIYSQRAIAIEVELG